MLTQTLVALKDRIGFDMHARADITSWACEHIENCGNNPARLLDVGLGDSEDLLLLRDSQMSVRVELFGIEYYEPRIVHARARGIEVFDINLEKEPIPMLDASLDVLMANQVVEHLKELPFFFSEVSRVLRPGGICIIGCPNLGGWQNRAALLGGNLPA